MTATLAASTAILKVRYPDGRLPISTYKTFKYVATVKTREDFTGEKRVVALQNENPQGSSADFPTAQGSLKQGVYNKFEVTRVEHFGVARVKGQALKAAEGDEGALVDLWKNETEGISRVELMNHEIYCFGNGSGVLGQIASGQGGLTVTLSVTSDIAKFALGMRLQVVSDATLSPTLVGGGATVTVTAIDRTLGTLTAAAIWNTTVPGLATNTYYLVRAGDYATGGTAGVLMGMKGWIVGGASPGTLFGLNRNSDPVRLSGQTYAATNVPLEEAVQEMSALVAQQGAMQPKRLWCHVRDAANMRKALGTKVTYPRTTVGGMGGIGFSGVEIEGDDGTITMMTSPFIDRNTAFLIDESSFTLDSVGPAPHLQNYDKADFLRVAGDDAVEARFASYVNHYTNNPVGCIVATGFGA